MHPLLYVAGGAATLFAGSKLFNLGQLSKDLVIDSSFRIHDYSLYPPTLVLAVDIVLKNPSKGTITVNHPTVNLFASAQDMAANNAIATSRIENKTYRIPKIGQTDPIAVILPIPLLKAAPLVVNLAKNRKLTLFRREQTLIAGNIPKKEEKSTTINLDDFLKKKAA